MTSVLLSLPSSPGRKFLCSDSKIEDRTNVVIHMLLNNNVHFF